jgi:hypothetical protein
MENYLGDLLELDPQRSEEDLNLKTLNKGAIDIYEMHYVLVESIRHYISRMVCECDGKYKCNLPVGGKNVVEITEQEGEGIIFIKFEGEQDYAEFDDLSLDDLMTLVWDMEHN